jgi:hypothetical protein
MMQFVIIILHVQDVSILQWCFMLLSCRLQQHVVVWYVGTSVSERHPSSVFKVDVVQFSDVVVADSHTR